MHPKITSHIFNTVAAGALFIGIGSIVSFPAYADSDPFHFDCEVRYDLSLTGCHSNRETGRAEMVLVTSSPPAGGGFVPPPGPEYPPLEPGGQFAPFEGEAAVPHAESALAIGAHGIDSKNRLGGVEKVAVERTYGGAQSTEGRID